jgi:hypothetical protein
MEQKAKQINGDQYGVVVPTSKFDVELLRHLIYTDIERAKEADQAVMDCLYDYSLDDVEGDGFADGSLILLGDYEDDEVVETSVRLFLVIAENPAGNSTSRHRLAAADGRFCDLQGLAERGRKLRLPTHFG